MTNTYQWIDQSGDNISGETTAATSWDALQAEQPPHIKVTNSTTGRSKIFSVDSPIAVAPGPDPVLDTYIGSTGGYSLRKLRTAYTGAAIKVRRSSDDAEQDIGFSGKNLNTSDLLTFCGSGDGFVTTIYDQSGSINNAIQAVDANQPKIVSSGVLVTDGGFPAIEVTAGNGFSSSVWGAGRIDYFMLSSTAQVWFLHFYNGLKYSWAAQDGSASAPYDTFGTPDLFVNGSAAASTTRDEVHDGLVGRKIHSTINASITGWSGISWFDFGFGFAFGGKFQELIVFDSDQSANRAAIESDINAYWDGY